MKIKENKGITLVALTIMIVIILILAGTTIYSGKKIIQETKLEGLKTNMLLIEAKARGYVEEVNFKMGPEKDATKKEEAIQQIYIDEVGFKKADDASLSISVPQGSGIDLSSCYCVTQDALKNMGLEKIETEEGEYYLIQFNEDDAIVVNIYNTIGYKGNFSLSQLEALDE